MITSFKQVRNILSQRVPGQVIIQITDRCNALCPQCGMRRTSKFPRTKLSMDDIKSIVDKAVENDVEAISFTGGEPMLFVDELCELIKYAGKAGIKYTRTGTNGYLFRYKGENVDVFKDRVKGIVEKLADTPLRNFWISIDSAVPQVHEEMRGFEGLIKGIEMSLPIFHDAGIFPSANLGINRNVGGSVTMDHYLPEEEQDKEYLQKFYKIYRKAFRRFYEFVCDMGFTMVNTCYPMSVSSGSADGDLSTVYEASSLEKIVNFSEKERAVLFQALLNTVPEYRDQIRIFSPMSSLYALVQQYSQKRHQSYGCRGGIDFFFIDSRDGNTYPCGFRGNESMGRYEDLDVKNINSSTQCTKCDWECFRDPSALFGPFLQGMGNPMELYRQFRGDRQYFRYWKNDLKYYKACGYFNGRTRPNYYRLMDFDHHVSVHHLNTVF